MTMSFAIQRWHALGGVVLAATLVAAQPVTSAAQELQSPALVKELSTLMTAAKLDVIALPDPEAPDAFIAAMLIPDVQLLVVTSRISTPDYILSQIVAKQYQDVYGTLQQSDRPDSRVFFQDLGVDGLAPRNSDSVDIMYAGRSQTLFGGKDGVTDPKKVQEADAKYSRLLQLAIEAARKHLT